MIKVGYSGFVKWKTMCFSVKLTMIILEIALIFMDCNNYLIITSIIIYIISDDLEMILSPESPTDEEMEDERFINII